MNLQLDFERLRLAHKTVRAELMAERSADGHWVGKLAGSPVATAMAVSALVVAHRRMPTTSFELARPPTGLRWTTRGGVQPAEDDSAFDNIVQGQLSELVVSSLHWLTGIQNADGGWGDCRRARSNVAATTLVQAAFRLTGMPAEHADLMACADRFVAVQGGVSTLRRAGSGKAWAAAVLVNCALAGMVPWRRVPPLTFEQVDRPPWWRRWLPAASALPPATSDSTVATLAARLVKCRFEPLRNPLVRFSHRGMEAASLAQLERLQAADGSFLAAPPLTALVVMSLASTGYREHSIVLRGVEFLLSSVRADASWPIVTDLATRNTTLAVWAECGLGIVDSGSDTAVNPQSAIHNSQFDSDEGCLGGHDQELLTAPCLDWLLSCQQTTDQGPTGIRPGGWSWSDSPGAMPNASDTAGTLLALAYWRRGVPAMRRERVQQAARRGIAWLLDQQNDDGGWPLFCRPSNSRCRGPSAVDLTSDALRAIAAWKDLWQSAADGEMVPHAVRIDRVPAAIDRGIAWLLTQQREDGSFAASSFGNEQQADGQNPVYGAARVIMACAELGRLEMEMARRAAHWLIRSQHGGGGWGPPRAPLDYSGTHHTGGPRSLRTNDALAKSCSVEEAAWAVTALLPLVEGDPAYALAVARGLNWLASAVEQDQHRRPAVVGVWPTKLWYHERLFPLTYTAGALARAVRQLAPQPVATLNV